MYTIKFKDGRKSIKTKDVIKVVEAIAGLKRDEFEVIESAKQPERSAYGGREEEKQAFISSLTPAQYNDVCNGVKEAKYTNKLDEDGKVIGWYLKFNPPTQETHISIQENQQKRVLEYVKFVIKSLKYSIKKHIEMNSDFTDEEFEEAFNKIIKQ